MKIKFNSDGDLPSKKTLQLCSMVIVVRSVFDECNKCYTRLFIDECSNFKLWNIKGSMCQELMLVRQVHQKNVIFVTISIVYLMGLSFNHISVMGFMI